MWYLEAGGADAKLHSHLWPIWQQIRRRKKGKKPDLIRQMSEKQPQQFWTQVDVEPIVRCVWLVIKYLRQASHFAFTLIPCLFNHLYPCPVLYNLHNRLILILRFHRPRHLFFWDVMFDIFLDQFTRDRRDCMKTNKYVYTPKRLSCY